MRLKIYLEKTQAFIGSNDAGFQKGFHPIAK
jgi:hypothetical protein